MNTTIDLDKYLSEDEKIEIARSEYRAIIRENIFKDFDKNPTKRMENYERIMSNAVHYYLQENIDVLLGKDSKEIIAENVAKVINNNSTYEYKVFRVKNAWDTEDSPAQTFLKSAVNRK